MITPKIIQTTFLDVDENDSGILILENHLYQPPTINGQILINEMKYEIIRTSDESGEYRPFTRFIYVKKIKN